MDFCVICLLIFLWKATCSPISTEESAILQKLQIDFPQQITQRGKSLRTIPCGNQDIISVDFSYNRISALPPYTFYFKGYRFLTRIELSQNKISNVNLKAFKELKLLKQVDLSGNNISYIEPFTFKTNAKLEKLDLSNNKISFQFNRPFLNSPSLESLILTDNRVEQIHEITFYKLPRLRNLMMDNNLIFVIEARSFAQMKQLQYLSLANSGVDRLSESMFLDNETLPRILDLTDTPLASKFRPKLRKVKNGAVLDLLNIDRYF